MQEILTTNDPVLLSFVEDLLRQAGVHATVLDRNMSIMEGSIGILPRRVLVSDDDVQRANQILAEADLEKWMPASKSAQQTR